MVSPRNALESLSARAAGMIPHDATIQRHQTEVAANQRLQTEEASKQALVLPFIQAMGYDIFDHAEVIPEYTADHGTKQGEKVDYAIMCDGKPIIIFECKQAGDPLNVERASQLSRYFHNTEARIGVLTGGLRYKFYSDLDAENKMDESPFLEFDIRALDSKVIAELERFAKGQFNIEDIKTSASKMLHIAGTKEYLGKMHQHPDEAFVRLIAAAVGYPPDGGRMSAPRLEYFTGLVRESFQGFVRDRIESTVRSAIARQDTDDDTASTEDASEISGDTDRTEGDIITTVEEQEAYEMVKAIVSNVVTPERVTIHDTKFYCAVVIDGNSRQTVCRFRFGPRGKNLCFGPFGQEERYQLESLANIADYADRLREAAAGYLQG